MSGFFFSTTYTHTSRAGAGRYLNNKQNNPRRKHSLCVYITNPACRNARRVVWVVFLLFNFFVCLFVYKKKKELRRLSGMISRYRCRQNADFSPHRWVYSLMNCCVRVWSKLILHSRYLFLSFSSFSGYYYCGCWPPRSSLQPLM